MSHFDYFSKIPYDVKGDNNFKVFTHILKRIGILSEVKDTVVTYDFYELKIGQTPEEIALKYYEDSSLYWLIFLANDIKDRYHDWPMSEQQFERFISDKYGTNYNSVHHYEISQTSGDTNQKINIGTDNTDYPTATAVTNYEYELTVQEKRRKIRLIKREYVDQIISELEVAVE